MTKLQEKLIQARKTGSLYFDQIMDIRDETKKRVKAVLKAYDVGDVEDIKEVDLRKTTRELEQASDSLAHYAEEIWKLMERVYDIDLSQY